MNVSRETMAELEAYQSLLLKWSSTINLVSKSSRSDLWERHIVDSIQIYPNGAKFGHWVDLGSGGGLPGVVIAVIAKQRNPDSRFTLVESDHRKAVFLRTAARELNLKMDIISDRIDNVQHLNADIVSARALAPLSTLLGYVDQHMNQTGMALLMKGEKWRQEHKEAQKLWSYQLDAMPSETNIDAAILKITELSRA